MPSDKPTTRHRPGEIEVLSQRALNRALLARQMLLGREARRALDVIDFLVGLQAQVPRDPYLALGSRIEGFDPAEVERLILAKQVARSPLLRTTIHLATARDCLAIRPLMEPILRRTMQGAFGKRLAGADLEALAGEGHALLDGEPRTFAQLRTLLRDRWAQSDDGQALSYSISYLVPLVQVPPRGLWNKTNQPTWQTTERYFGKPLAKRPSLGDLVMRYFAAFGPATVNDVQAWCCLTKLAEVVDRLRPRLVTFRDEQGHELFDVPDAPRPDPSTPAPVRFLPQYDNVFLGHADRSRLSSEKYPLPPPPATEWVSPLFLEGYIAGWWKLAQDRKAATLKVIPSGGWTKRDRTAVEREGWLALGFLAGGADTREVVFEG